MRKPIIALGFGLGLAACAQAPTPAAPPPAPAPMAAAPPVQLQAVVPEQPLDAALVAAAQANLRSLGYPAGKSDDIADPALRRALMAFQRDEGLPEDGHLTLALVERLKAARAAMAKPVAVETARRAVFVYSDGYAGVARGLLIAPPKGMAADAPVNFLQPLKAGTLASFHMGPRAANGAVAPAHTITCRVSRAPQVNSPLGLIDALAVDCRTDDGDAHPLSWHSLYSPTLKAAVSQEAEGDARVLVAVRPMTSDWPSAARTGFDWALTHALETPANTPVPWSSTGVAQHFEIRASTQLTGAEAGLPGKYATLSCRRFDMVQGGSPIAHFPGLACENGDGSWSLPGGPRLAAPGGTLHAKPAAPALRSAQK